MSPSSKVDRTDLETRLRSRCHGVVPLSARLEPWQAVLCDEPERLAGLLERFGSPLNVHEFSGLRRNVGELTEAANRQGLDLRVFAARKANKTLGLIDAALVLGLGLDLASETELAQSLGRGATPGEMIMTAAIKPRPLLELCARSGVLVALDNADELALLAEVASETETRPAVALRLAPSGFESRFGFTAAEALAAAAEISPSREAGLRLEGIHFHLDGYSAADRVTAASEALDLIDSLQAAGHQIRFLDIGGGIPISYLDAAAQQDRFWIEHRRGLLAEREPITYRGHGLGLRAHRGELIGEPSVYPCHQEPIRGGWLEQVLLSPVTPTATSAAAGVGPRLGAALRERRLELRCEPGRALLDGCGLTAARVEYRKRGPDGHWLIGLAMNRTQCRSSADDFLVDPLLVAAGPGRRERRQSESMEGYLVGAYCIELELLSWRRLIFPDGVEIGDIIVFPNTAGYLMHILESASHQMPLARNVVIGRNGAVSEDPIDFPAAGAARGAAG